MEYPDIRIYPWDHVHVSHFSCNFVVYRYAHVCPIFGQNLTHPKASFFSAFALAAALALALAAASGLGSAHLFPPVWKAWRLEGVGKYGNTNSSRYFLHHRLTLEIVKACLLFWIWIRGDLPLFSLQRLLNGDTTHQKLRTPQWVLNGFKIVCWTPDDLMWRTEQLYKYSICMYMHDITRLREASSETSLRTSTISAWAWYDVTQELEAHSINLYQHLLCHLLVVLHPLLCLRSNTRILKIQWLLWHITSGRIWLTHVDTRVSQPSWHRRSWSWWSWTFSWSFTTKQMLCTAKNTHRGCRKVMTLHFAVQYINFKFLVRVASGICGGTEPIKSNWTCSRSLQLGVVCVFERANQSCFQKIFGQWLPATLSSHSFQPKGDEHHTSTTIVTTLAFAARQDSK